MPRFPHPPSDLTGAFANWCWEIWRHIESMPRISYHSFGATETPDSRVSGLSGDLCVNLGSASTNSRLFVLGGASRSAFTNQGWQLVRVVDV